MPATLPEPGFQLLKVGYIRVENTDW